MNFKHTGNKEYSYVHVGSWDQGGLRMDDHEIWTNHSDIIQSVCSEPCQRAQIKVAMETTKPESSLHHRHSNTSCRLVGSLSI